MSKNIIFPKLESQIGRGVNESINLSRKYSVYELLFIDLNAIDFVAHDTCVSERDTGDFDWCARCACLFECQSIIPIMLSSRQSAIAKRREQHTREAEQHRFMLSILFNSIGV